MARSPTKQSSKVEVNSFVKGLITEASPLNFPPNATFDEANFELNRDGTRDRRRGMGYEPSFALRSTGYIVDSTINRGINSYVWSSVEGDASKEFVVVQIENSLHVYDSQVESVSGTGFIDQIDIVEFPVGIRFSFTTVEGKMTVAAGVDTVAIISYNESTLLSYRLERLKVRDIWGMEVFGFGADDAYETDPQYRGPSDPLPFSQAYNLQNQTWGIPRTTAEGSPEDPITYFKLKLGSFPSNSEIVYSGLQFQPVSAGVDPFERMFTSMYDDVRGVGLKAPKGYFIIDLLRRGQSRVEQSLANKVTFPHLDYWFTAGPADFTPGGARVVQGFAGRVFYSGFSGAVLEGDKRSPNLNSYIAFSQLVSNITDITKCYQEGSPTSREASDLVDTDGGLVKVSDAENILGLRVLGNSLIIFANNGVWELSGGSDFGFSATNYKLNRISTAGAFSESTIVQQQGRIFFWGRDGIYVVAPDQFSVLTAQNITQTTIQKFYEDIPSTSKEKAQGVYDEYSKKVRWLYNTTSLFSLDSETKELVFDTVLGAFYVNTIGKIGTKVEAADLFVSAPFRLGLESTDVIVGTDLVVADGEQVVISEITRSSGLQSVKYLVLQDVGGILNITFSFYKNIEFIDWKEVDGIGVDAKAFFITGAQTAGDSSVDKQIPYLVAHFRRTEDGILPSGEIRNRSSCFMRMQWDFANTVNSRKWSQLVQTYRYNTPHLITNPEFDSGFEVITTKNKMRGKGRAFSMYVETEPLRDCRIIGWNLSVNGNSVV